MPIENADQIRERSIKATDEGIPQFNWIPPQWTDVSQTRKLTDTASKKYGFPPYPNGGNITEFVESRKARNPEGQPGDPPNPDRWPHPFSDFTHIDPIKSDDASIKFSGSEFKDIGDGLTTLENNQASSDKRDLERMRKYVQQFGEIAGPNSFGFQRLASVFEWTIFQATVLLNEINKSLNDKSGQAQEKYEAARANYLAFLKDLDDHEPATTPREMIKGKGKIGVEPGKRGYGRTIKWSYIDPIIVNGRIEEARVIIHWNPHSSSNGVPINHP
jgi:hypothetical protein